MKHDSYEKLAAWLAGEQGAAAPPEAESSEGKQAREAWKLSGRYRYKGNTGDDWDTFTHRKLNLSPMNEESPGRQINYWLLGAAIAASIAAIWFSFFYQPKQVIPGAMETAVYYNSAPGEHKNLDLPDASRVQLNAGSALWVLPGYGKNVRNVELKGEAYFDVKPGDQAFTVKAGKSEIKVTGTSFNIRNYTDDVYVQVKEGRVVVTNGAKQVEILAGQGAVYSASNNTLVTLQGDSLAWAWTRGALVFRNATLNEVAADLGRNFNVRLVVPKAMEERRYTGSFDNMELQTILAIIEKAMGVRLEVAADE